jgi:hypothetical protein
MLRRGEGIGLGRAQPEGNRKTAAYKQESVTHRASYS